MFITFLYQILFVSNYCISLHKLNIMLENIEQYTKQLGLAERTQPSATEIYNTKGIPTATAMPTFIVESSLPAFVESKEESVLSKSKSGTGIGRIFIPDTALPCLSFANAQQRYINKIEAYIFELQRWHYEVYARKFHYPHKEDYNKKIEEICGKLNEESPGYPFACYFATGADDTAAAGAYLLSLSPSKENKKKERQAVIWLSGIQWLIRMRDALPEKIPDEASAGSGSDIPIPKDDSPSAEENEQAELRYLIEKLKLTAPVTEYDLNEEKTDNQEMLAAVRLAYFIEGKEWANNVNAFSIRIADCQNDNSGTQSTTQYKSDTFRNRMRRNGPSFSDDDYNQYLKGDKQLQPQIRNYYKKWEEKVTYVQQLLTLFRTDTGQNGQTPDNNGQLS